MVTASAEGERASVLTPKLRVPLLPESAVQRSRLLTTMAVDEANGVRVTIASAPAGSGKTLLLAERSAVLRAAGQATAWVSLAEEDNDPFVLWSSILAALTRAVGAADPPTGLALGALGPPVRRMEPGFLTAFLEIMHTCQVPVWLVLDDAHELVGREALDSLRTIVRGLPAALRLMLGCRHDLSLPLGRLAVAGQVRDIRFAEIAFDRAEVDQLLVSHDIDLHDDDVETLLARTEGWAAGLRLATLSMIRHDDAAKFVAGFAGDSRPVADYLVSEILSHQATGVLEFLLATAGPDRLSVDLARRLSGRDDAGIVLDRLERANALVMRLGEGSTWYRYHALLRSYLRAELDRRDVVAQRRLNLTAADWFIEHDLPRSALDHAAAAADWDRVAQIVDRFGLRLLLSGESGALARVLTLLPADVAARPVVALTAALTALEAGDLPTATRQLDRIGRESPRHRDPRLQVLHATALLYETRLRGDREAPLATLIESASSHAVPDPDLELLSLANRGIARLWLGEYSEAEADLSAALRLARRDSRDFLALDCLSHLSATAAAQNDFVAMADRAREAIAFAKERGWASSVRMASAYLVAAWAAWQMLDGSAATRYATLAAAVIETDVEPEVDTAARCLGAFVDFERGVDRRGALQRLRRDWLRLDGKRLTPALIGFLCGTEQQLALTIGETGWAADVAARAERYLGDVGDTQGPAGDHGGTPRPECRSAQGVGPGFDRGEALPRGDVGNCRVVDGSPLRRPSWGGESRPRCVDLRAGSRGATAGDAQPGTCSDPGSWPVDTQRRQVRCPRRFRRRSAVGRRRNRAGTPFGARRGADEPRASCLTRPAVLTVGGTDGRSARRQCQHGQDPSQGDLPKVGRRQPAGSSRSGP